MSQQATVLIGIPCLLVGGTEIQTLRLVEALTSGGYKCITVCYFEYDNGMVEQYKEAGSEVWCLSKEGKRPEGSLGVYRFLRAGLKRAVATYHPTLAHIQYMAPGAIPIVILRRLGIKTIVATLHTDASIYRSLRLVHWLQRHTVKAFTCVSEQAERSFFGSSQLYDSQLKLGRHNHFTIPNCLPPNTEVEQPSQNKPEGKVIGMVARLEKIKGADLALPAFAEVTKQQPECQLIIVGDGKLQETLRHQQRELGIGEDKVLWTGRLEQKALAEWYRKMDVVWVPSRTEGFGLSAIEAMTFSLPLVAAATGGLTEIITDGKEGFLFETGNAHDLATKTHTLLDAPERMAQMGQAASRRAMDYSFDHYRERVLGLYSQLADK